MRSKINLKSSFPSSLLPNSTCSSASHAGRQEMGVMVSSSHIVPASAQGEESSLASVWGPSHRRQFSINFSDMSLSHGQQQLFVNI